MKILVIGGAGQVGQWVSRGLAVAKDVEQLLIADLNEQRACDLVAAISRPGLSQVPNAADPAALAQAARGADLVMDCTSFGSQAVFDLAMQANARYANLISAHDDGSNDHRARQNGVIAVAGLGLSPGLANILAQHASRAFGELHEYHIYWVSFRSPAPTRGGLDTITWELANHCPERGYFLNGRWRPAGFMEGSRLVDFGGAIGEQRVYFVPHPEVTDLPRSFPSLRYCSVRGTWQRELMEEFRILNSYGLLEADTIEQTKAQIWAQQGGRHQFGWPEHSAAVFEASGPLNGNTVVRRYTIRGPQSWGEEAMSRMTGLCAAVQAQMLAGLTSPLSGVVPSELLFDPNHMLELIKTYGELQIDWTDTVVD
ncbi:hypothetical protein G7009_06455 [Pseudomonas capeferrum]|uniref:saccharopine dehydrogenase NADP-binding domain-containing protein n=1 Tax=Pseudomonas capeferrum TaxID=1495066 RepID=UPI0015E3187A|nr:saccharopine dehydrogenase NADP-binding domain-containing protein [Pseudomonas capeferrum]MBA1201406.1 hypothetical protein [Pseudomonas capeferrum]